MSYIAPKDQCHCQPSSGPFHSRMEAVMTCAQVYQKLDRWGKRRFYHYAVWNGTQELPHAGCHHICHQESRCLFFKSSPIWLIPTWCKKQDWQVYVCVFFCVFLFWFGFFLILGRGAFVAFFFFWRSVVTYTQTRSREKSKVAEKSNGKWQQFQER